MLIVVSNESLIITEVPIHYHNLPKIIPTYNEFTVLCPYTVRQQVWRDTEESILPREVTKLSGDHVDS